MEEFMMTTGIRLEIPKKYINMSSLDDLKTRFIQKKTIMQFEEAQRKGIQVDP
jgi:hypothetical protein